MRYLFKRKHNSDYNCSTCGTRTESKVVFGSIMPALLEGLSKREMKKRVVLTDDYASSMKLISLSTDASKFQSLEKTILSSGMSGYHSVRITFSKSSIYGMNQRVLTSIRCSAGYRRNFLSIQIPSI